MRDLQDSQNQHTQVLGQNWANLQDPEEVHSLKQDQESKIQPHQPWVPNLQEKKYDNEIYFKHVKKKKHLQKQYVNHDNSNCIIDQ